MSNGTQVVGGWRPVAQSTLLPSLRAIARLFRRKPLGMGGLVILLVIALSAVFAPVLTQYSFEVTDFTSRLQAPSAEHYFGTDNLGRDLFSRLLYGTRTSLGISALAVLLASSLAGASAVISGYYGGWIDKVSQRVFDVWLALPELIVLVTMLGVLGASPLTLLLVVGLANVPRTQRLIRSVVLSVRSEAYIEAAQSVGATDLRTMLQHILPNIMYILIYSATVTLGQVILTVASLGFLGYGIPPPAPDLGGMLSGGGLTFMLRQPWMAIMPGLTITLIVFSFNVFGDALRDILDPRMRSAS